MSDQFPDRVEVEATRLWYRYWIAGVLGVVLAAFGVLVVMALGALLALWAFA